MLLSSYLTRKRRKTPFVTFPAPSALEARFGKFGRDGADQKSPLESLATLLRGMRYYNLQKIKGTIFGRFVRKLAERCPRNFDKISQKFWKTDSVKMYWISYFYFVISLSSKSRKLWNILTTSEQHFTEFFKICSILWNSTKSHWHLQKKWCRSSENPQNLEWRTDDLVY